MYSVYSEDPTFCRITHRLKPSVHLDLHTCRPTQKAEAADTVAEQGSPVGLSHSSLRKPSMYCNPGLRITPELCIDGLLLKEK